LYHKQKQNIMKNFEYTIERKTKGTRTFFFPTKNGKRFTNINYARKWEAKKLVSDSIKHFGIEKLEEIFK